MADYKYRALGWQDDDIASLNVIDGTAADNQVELQITKQGEGGTINGPAIKGADGITIDAADPNTVKISGSGLVQDPAPGKNNTGAALTIQKGFGDSDWNTAFKRNTVELLEHAGASDYVGYDTNGVIYAKTTSNSDYSVTNKKYVADNYVKKVTTVNRVYVTDKDGLADTAALAYSPIAYGVSAYDEGGRITTNEPVDNLDCANKKFVEDAVAAGGATVDGTSIVKDTDGKIQLNQEYIDYLDNQLYQPPAISVFTMLDATGAALPTSNELGTTLSAAAFNHQETNIKNIQGDNVELHINNAAAATTSTAKKDVATKVMLTTAQSITNSTKFTLKGTNTKGAAFSRDYQVSFYRYAYTAITDATTAPTSGATQQAAVSTFASNGNTFNYTKGGYIYFYTDNTGKKVQTNVLGQWADVDTTDIGKVTLTQKNGATHEYTCYRIGPFIETDSAKYRV